jgi:hypothetical protein
MTEPAQSKTRTCAGCGIEFEPTRYWQRFHSQECRYKFHIEEARRAREAWRKEHHGDLPSL